MTAAQSYLDSHAARMHADAKTLGEVRVNIDHLRRRIADDQSNLDAAEQFEKVLVKVIAAGQRLLDEEWQEDWKVDQNGRLSQGNPSITQAEGFAVVQVAKPVMQGGELVCDWASCGMELIGSDVEGWLHAETGREECKPPAVQEGTDGSPLLPTIIPPHGVEVTRDDA